jgi:hypothetical protein
MYVQLFVSCLVSWKSGITTRSFASRSDTAFPTDSTWYKQLYIHNVHIMCIYHIICYQIHLVSAELELTTLLVIDTDCIYDHDHDGPLFVNVNIIVIHYMPLNWLLRLYMISGGRETFHPHMPDMPYSHSLLLSQAFKDMWLGVRIVGMTATTFAWTVVSVSL